jgi:hypothetical protein
MDSRTEVDSDSITLTGAGFTKAFFPEAPLLGESLKRTLEFINYEIEVKKVRTYDDYLGIYKKFQRGDRNLEMLLTRYFEILEKKNKSEQTTSEEESEYQALGYLKCAFLHLIDSTTPWESYWKDSDLSAWPESLSFTEYQQCKRIKELSDYFINKRESDLQVTVNYDTLLESVFDSFPEPENHEHRIQHIHGSRAWHLNPITRKIYSDPKSRTYSNRPDDPLILPINNKKRWSVRFSWYGKKMDIIKVHFKNCKRLTIIGCGLNKSDEILSELIGSLDAECKVLYVSDSCKSYESIQKIFEKQKVTHLSCGFRIGCLD